ncbi:hypothetical protein P280DRAFT_464449 [Massarina eburnea CBS 473.64]|uniref:BTB domain-containing protein n=1 Tax=Massarina eburnea CBS 473.64 TaxID=1395130 RepID=A0A6A6SFY8_9PLEO|nr:hypothetical protein P280DRAFT_464449 [Massarina eburnea CBS 473.64]
MNQAEDVEIVLTHDRKYKFHSGTLARNSTLLNEMLIEPNAAKLSNKAKNAGITIKWMIELKETPTHEYPAGRLGLVDLTSSGERADFRTGLVINENGRVPTKIFDHYESIFYAFYNKEIRICDTDMRAALEDVMQIINIADYLGCTNIISKPVEVALLKHGQTLYRSIQSTPAGWARMAYDLKSECIFTEAMIHLVGNWARNKDTSNEKLREYPQIKALVKKYYRILYQKGKTLENQVASCYPGDMQTPSTDLPIKREVFSKDILVWMALCFFRHWLGQRIISGKGHGGEDGGFELYQQLGAAGEAYMNKIVMNQFHAKIPMTKKAFNVLENHLLEIKECIKGIVDKSNILQSNCQLDVNKFPVTYLTCTKFDREDFPWLSAAAQKTPPKVNSIKRGIRPGGNEIAKQNLEAARGQERDRADEHYEDMDSEDESEGISARKRVRHN